MEARSRGQPALDSVCLVRAVVVHHEVDVQHFRDVGLDGSQKLQGLRTAVPALRLPDDLAGGHIERGKQRGRAMANVPILPGYHRLGRYCAVSTDRSPFERSSDEAPLTDSNQSSPPYLRSKPPYLALLALNELQQSRAPPRQRSIGLHDIFHLIATSQRVEDVCPVLHEHLP